MSFELQCVSRPTAERRLVYSEGPLDAESNVCEPPTLGDLPRLPTPLGTLLYTSPYFAKLSIEDRLSAIPLVRRCRLTLSNPR